MPYAAATTEVNIQVLAKLPAKTDETLLFSLLEQKKHMSFKE